MIVPCGKQGAPKASIPKTAPAVDPDTAQSLLPPTLGARPLSTLLRTPCNKTKGGEEGGRSHRWGMAEVPSGLSGRKSSHTPKEFLNPQCASAGVQLLNSPIRHSACWGDSKGGGVVVVGVRVWVLNVYMLNCGCIAPPPAPAPQKNNDPLSPHLCTGRPLAVPDALLALVLPAVQPKVLVACGTWVEGRAVASVGGRPI